MVKRIKFKLLLLLTPLWVLLVRILARTIRWKKRYDFDRDKRTIYALWHGQALALAMFGMDRGIYTMASRFRDGELATAILKGMGFNVVRGSTEEGKAEKGGRTGTLKLIEALNKGHNVALTVDGPKGPPFKVKKGVVFLAQKTGAKIVPAVVRFEKAKVFNSWDRFTVPYPFTRGEVLVGEPITVSEGDDLEAKRKEIEKALLELSSEVVSS
ncbi:MAG: lysophospholipid acyltransferase family protein [Aquificae bacterium]|nr:lysophospholipid acyltransferase family protein [Aquificota bacterium]